jgi:ElaB/YqjD/DUF883 family membrane-anchored ribosome-binding protein
MPFGRKKSLMDRAHGYVDQISDQFSETVLPQLEHAWEQAVDKAGPAISDARDKAAPLIEEARTRATEVASAGAATAAEKTAEARDKAAPLLAEYRASAAERAAAVASTAATVASERAAEGRELATAKVNELRGVEPEPKGGKLKKFLLFGALLAIGGAIFNKVRAKQDDAWQSTYVPPAPPAPKPAAPTPPAPAAPADEVTADDVVTEEPPAVEDAGGGAPGEAISDSAEEAHEATTPDEPAEVIDIDDVPQKK